MHSTTRAHSLTLDRCSLSSPPSSLVRADRKGIALHRCPSMSPRTAQNRHASDQIANLRHQAGIESPLVQLFLRFPPVLCPLALRALVVAVRIRAPPLALPAWPLSH